MRAGEVSYACGSPKFNAGDIVGDADGIVFVRRYGVVETLGPGTALDINDTGPIAGYAPGRVPVLWHNGVGA